MAKHSTPHETPRRTKPTSSTSTRNRVRLNASGPNTITNKKVGLARHNSDMTYVFNNLPRQEIATPIAKSHPAVARSNHKDQACAAVRNLIPPRGSRRFGGPPCQEKSAI